MHRQMDTSPWILSNLPGFPFKRKWRISSPAYVQPGLCTAELPGVQLASRRYLTSHSHASRCTLAQRLPVSNVDGKTRNLSASGGDVERDKRKELRKPRRPLRLVSQAQAKAGVNDPEGAVPRSRLALISCVYVPYARSIFRLKCSFRLLMLSTSLSSWCALRRLYAARFDFLCR